jgi:hypothetical protein
MFHGLEHLFGPIFEKLFGLQAICGGMLLAVALWFLDYALLEWRVRKHYSIMMTATGVAFVFAVVQVDWEPSALFRCAVVGFLFYVPLRLSIRRSAYARTR